jgi:hypothetical protein
MVLLSCHIPFIFFAGKEALLIMIDEVDRRSISNALWHKLYASNNHFAKENEDNMPPAPLLPVPGTDEPFLDFDDKAPEEDIRASRMTGLTAAKSFLSTMTADEANRLAYKDMKLSLYLIGTLTFYAVVLTGSILIPSVTIVFDFVGAFAISAIAFVFPGLFYLTGAKRFGKQTNFYMRMSYLFITIGFFNCLIGIASAILEIIESE